MKSKIKRNMTFVISLVLLLLCLLPATGFAATQTEIPTGIDFTVQAVIPDNQLDMSHTYFDLSVTPGQQQKLALEIDNLSTESITVQVDAISASTNSNGVIDYKTADIKDETLKHPFSEIAKVDTPKVTIPANETEVIYTTVTMPDEIYDGVILGGLVIAKEESEAVVDRPKDAEEQTMDGPVAKIKNTYSYVVAVQLRETSQLVQPDFELVSANMGTSNYQPAVLFGIRNKEAAVAKDLTLEAKLYAKSNPEIPVLEMKKEGIEMAPNSVAELAISELNGRLTAGMYDLNIHMYTQEKRWDMQAEIKIDQTDIQNVADNEAAKTEKEPINTTALYVLIVVLAAAVVILILVLIGRSRKQNKTNKTMTKRTDRYTK